ncbi:MAG: hypothetical protein EDM74_09830 [Armatimonadetes bacterium]|nr:MAG: hypothetical protein EDM74_09830 [Armatimonadota bacterium]
MRGARQLDDTTSQLLNQRRGGYGKQLHDALLSDFRQERCGCPNEDVRGPAGRQSAIEPPSDDGLPANEGQPAGRSVRTVCGVEAQPISAVQLLLQPGVPVGVCAADEQRQSHDASMYRQGP